MADTQPGTRHQEPGFIATIIDDIGHVWREASHSGVRRTLGRTFAELREFYLTTERRDRLAGMPKVRRWFLMALWLLKSLFLKLNPARRVLLLGAFVLFGWKVQANTRGVEYGLNLTGVGVVVLLVILMLELKDKLLARDELKEGRSVQMALMPERSPRVPGWDVWLFTRPANDVGGDLVDHLQLDGDRHGLTLGDVAGKGLGAALLMAKLQSTFRALLPEFASLGELAGKVNRILCRDGLPNKFASTVYLEVRTGTGQVRVLNAGHMPPLVLRRDRVEEMPRGSIALGIMPGATFGEQAVELRPGEVLLVYSDGVTEAMNEQDEFFGDERLRVLLPGLERLAADEAGARVLAAVDRFVGEARRHDDLSLIVAKRIG